MVLDGCICFFLFLDTPFPFFPLCARMQKLKMPSGAVFCLRSKLLWHITSVFRLVAFLPSIQISYHRWAQVHHRFVIGLSMLSTHKAPKDERQALADTGRLECTHCHCCHCCFLLPVAVPIYRQMKSSMLKICSSLKICALCAFLWGYTIFTLFNFQLFFLGFPFWYEIYSCWRSLKVVDKTGTLVISRDGRASDLESAELPGAKGQALKDFKVQSLQQKSPTDPADLWCFNVSLMFH